MPVQLCSSHHGEEDTSRTTIFFLSFLHCVDSFFLADTVVSEPRLHLQMLETEMIVKQDTVSVFLHLYVKTF